MLAATPRTLSGGSSSSSSAAPTASLRQRLRFSGKIAGSSSKTTASSATSSHPTPRSVSLLGPFRRRTESVNTVMSTASLGLEDVPPPVAASVDVAAAVAANSPEYPNILEWLESKCPGDVLPVVLAFCGPQQTAALSKTNKHWNALVRREGTWRVLCEELYKVRLFAGWFDCSYLSLTVFSLYRICGNKIFVPQFDLLPQ